LANRINSITGRVPSDLTSIGDWRSARIHRHQFSWWPAPSTPPQVISSVPRHGLIGLMKIDLPHARGISSSVRVDAT
jgi:hypothetical protein